MQRRTPAPKLWLPGLPMAPSPGRESTYEVPEAWYGVDAGCGTGLACTVENELSDFQQQLDSLTDRIESDDDSSDKPSANILPGFLRLSAARLSSVMPITSTPTSSPPEG
ncbi:hypothetical protein BT67DRAFT_288451 [Trichocladium antarcticum]|uniref:Uncharacterized protein n=1 Tax=Trichocladium antarcticum TaxID=1450529 RepID=A0AAN6ULK2_9PEZI|nr:hypothetical protein BT67DRAFT_288451 [Trichocladium antarcticum]